MTTENNTSYLDFYYDQAGSAPGTLFIGPNAVPPELVLIEYSAAHATCKSIEIAQLQLSCFEGGSVSWLDVQGVGSESILREVGDRFNLHQLVLADIVNVPQRPKVEQYDDQLVIIARMVTPRPDREGFYNEQVGFVLGKHYLLTVQEEPELDCFGPVRDRIQQNRGHLREAGPDYLAYALLDAIIDGFFPVLEHFGEVIEALEEEVVRNPSRTTVRKIYRLRRDLTVLRRAIWPQRAMVNQLARDSNSLISQEVQIHLQSCYDHVVQVLDIVESYRELASGLMDVYLSSVSNRMNEVMRVLTIISTIFIPLSFVAGVYGMNFDTDTSRWNMPELGWVYGYPACLLVMGAIAGGLVMFFWRKGWFQDFS
jgi:magnesium transporter